jgi:hypothetical protein
VTALPPDISLRVSSASLDLRSPLRAQPAGPAGPPLPAGRQSLILFKLEDVALNVTISPARVTDSIASPARGPAAAGGPGPPQRVLDGFVSLEGSLLQLRVTVGRMRAEARVRDAGLARALRKSPPDPLASLRYDATRGDDARAGGGRGDSGINTSNNINSINSINRSNSGSSNSINSSNDNINSINRIDSSNSINSSNNNINSSSNVDVVARFAALFSPSTGAISERSASSASASSSERGEEVGEVEEDAAAAAAAAGSSALRLAAEASQVAATEATPVVIISTKESDQLMIL